MILYELLHTICEFNIRVRNTEEKWRIWSNLNHPIHLKEMSRRTRLNKTRGKHPSPISTKVRRLKPNTKIHSPKMRPTSSASAVTCEVKYLTFYWEPRTISPGLWRIWNGTLGQPTAIDANHPSWTRHRLPSPTQRYQKSSLTRPPNDPNRTWIWTNIKRRLLTRPSIRKWGRRMSMKKKCTRSTTVL